MILSNIGRFTILVKNSLFWQDDWVFFGIFMISLRQFIATLVVISLVTSSFVYAEEADTAESEVIAELDIELKEIQSAEDAQDSASEEVTDVSSDDNPEPSTGDDPAEEVAEKSFEEISSEEEQADELIENNELSVDIIELSEIDTEDQGTIKAESPRGSWLVASSTSLTYTLNFT